MEQGSEPSTTAQHEAAHAVAALLVGFGLPIVRLNDPSDRRHDRRRGFARLEVPSDLDVAEVSARKLVVLSAPDAAAQLWLPPRRYGRMVTFTDSWDIRRIFDDLRRRDLPSPWDGVAGLLAHTRRLLSPHHDWWHRTALALDRERELGGDLVLALARSGDERDPAPSVRP